MLALGLSDTRVGFIATVYMLSQAVFAFFSGPITDKMGRRKATAIFDFFSWCIPCLIMVEGPEFLVLSDSGPSERSHESTDQFMGLPAH